jgi:hypothetical protein
MSQNDEWTTVKNDKKVQKKPNNSCGGNYGNSHHKKQYPDTVVQDQKALTKKRLDAVRWKIMTIIIENKSWETSLPEISKMMDAGSPNRELVPSVLAMFSLHEFFSVPSFIELAKKVVNIEVTYPIIHHALWPCYLEEPRLYKPDGDQGRVAAQNVAKITKRTDDDVLQFVKICIEQFGYNALSTDVKHDVKETALQSMAESFKNKSIKKDTYDALYTLLTEPNDATIASISINLCNKFKISETIDKNFSVCLAWIVSQNASIFCDKLFGTIMFATKVEATDNIYVVRTNMVTYLYNCLKNFEKKFAKETGFEKYFENEKFDHAAVVKLFEKTMLEKCEFYLTNEEMNNDSRTVNKSLIAGIAAKFGKLDDLKFLTGKNVPCSVFASAVAHKFHYCGKFNKSHLDLLEANSQDEKFTLSERVMCIRAIEFVTKKKYSSDKFSKIHETNKEKTIIVMQDVWNDDQDENSDDFDFEFFDKSVFETSALKRLLNDFSNVDNKHFFKGVQSIARENFTKTFDAFFGKFIEYINSENDICVLKTISEKIFINDLKKQFDDTMQKRRPIVIAYLDVDYPVWTKKVFNSFS